MALFLQCLQAFTDKPELLRNMMGLLGNVAEVKELRPRLMKDDYLQVFSDLLDSTSDGIEVSYNAAGILAHLVSDGAEQWERHGIRAVRRDQVLARMGRAIERWALLAKRNINYRSFEPILRLLGVRHTPQAQHWAVWALANLTQVYRFLKLENSAQKDEDDERRAQDSGHSRRVCRILRSECWRQVRFLYDYLRVLCLCGNPATTGLRKHREHLQLVAQVTEFLWQRVRLGFPKKMRPATPTQGGLTILGDVDVPEDVARTLSKGPKYSVEPRCFLISEVMNQLACIATLDKDTGRQMYILS
ncbi:protein zer-1 homolog [Ixodes scapularis]